MIYDGKHSLVDFMKQPGVHHSRPYLSPQLVFVHFLFFFSPSRFFFITLCASPVAMLFHMDVMAPSSLHRAVAWDARKNGLYTFQPLLFFLFVVFVGKISID